MRSHLDLFSGLGGDQLRYNWASEIECGSGALTPSRVAPKGLVSMRHQYTCAVCGATFTSYNPNPKYCSRPCKYEGDSARIDIERLRDLYASGHSQDECAVLLGVSQKAVCKAMRRHGLVTRPAIKRDQWGDRNHMWKGDQATRYAMHVRLYKRFGQEPECSVCGTTDQSKWYDWANLTGHYEDINDYRRMCRSCHRQYDKRRREVMPSDAA
jgi:hypothetical protein